MREHVLSFIDRFTFGGKREQVIEAFTCGCCYWFARILYERFRLYGASEIVYDQVENHFGCKVCGRVYDICGDVTEKYYWDLWPIQEDPSLTNRILRDCVDF